MIEYKSPKVIEKVPEVMGLDVGLTVTLVGCALGFLLTVTSSKFLLSLAFVVAGGAKYFIAIKFPEKGGLTQFIKYTTGSHCIKMDQEIKTLIKTKM